VIIGASLAGLFAAAAAAAAGARTMIIERDVLPETPVARKGVPQGRQPHVLLFRGFLAAEKLVPGLREDLLGHGAVPFDFGTLAWLGEYGWLPTWIPAYQTVSATRPLLEQLVRERVRNLEGVTVREGARVTELQHDTHRWRVVCEDGGEDGGSVSADVVIDASGRGSRLPHWLAELGVPVTEPLMVDAHLGYACQMYRAIEKPPIEIGVVIQATPQTGRGALAIPVEDGHWLVVAGGYGDRRPTRDPAQFDQFLAALPDPAIAELTQQLEPVGDIAIHRQTGNRRNRYGRSRSWPAGLLAVGDAYCAFNPVYGQGITVAACQALLI
jgi:flavin-dependent dehydrogenase